MNREAVAWVASVGLIVAVAVQRPGSLAARDDDHAFARAILDVRRQVADHYVEAVDDDALGMRAIEGMLGDLDPYTAYVPPARQAQFDQMLDGELIGVGIQLGQSPADDGGPGEVTVITPMPASPAYEAGVRAGDAILKVDGADVAGEKLDAVTARITGPPDTDVTLTVRRADGAVEDLTMRRRRIVVPTVKGVRYVPGSDRWDHAASSDPPIALVRVTQFTPGTTAALRRVIEAERAAGMKGLILDLRYNPGGNLDEARDTVDLFVADGVIYRTKGRNRPESVARATRAGTLGPFPMAVLVNEQSASAAEVVAGSLADHGRAMVVGARTFGKGSVQEVIRLSDGSGELKLTVAYYYLPSGRLVHRRPGSDDWGVRPQVEVPVDEPTQRAVLEAQFENEVLRGDAPPPATAPATGPSTRPVDEPLRRAIEVVAEQIAATAKAR